MAMPMAAFIMPPSSRRSARLAAQAQRDPANSTSDDPATRFGLAGLTVLPIPNIDDIATIYTQAKERRAQLDQGTSTQETLIYYNATTSHLDALHSTDPDRNYPGRITFFGDEIGLVFFKMLQAVHEDAHHRLFLEIRDILVLMGLGNNCVSVGSATYKGIGTQQKEGDSGIRPDPPRSAGNQFPTLVIEAGNSESLPQLHKEKDWWFDNSPPDQPEGGVRIVLVVKVYRLTKRIVVEQWHRYSQSPSATVLITPHPHKPFSLYDSSHWVVQGAPMVIPFEDVFLRLTEGLEMDIVLTEDFFANMGMRCWRTDTRV
ncbi:hypothetical protein B0T25DRAFT_529010 [Lasiosphaeria hispida]|uniref:Uncharacterized protein n=1 Tax=Lasiosphaeria hispida TaxID=260671 RepID=A0AAJ0MKP4_9PEZI|nr:hypothetical protein B0T25DRAFT_529010 [Lasiosphaeria hispida]